MSNSRAKEAIAGAPSYVAILGFALGSRLLARLPLPRLDALLTPRRRRQRPPERVELAARRVERVLWWTRRPLRHTCLTRGLTRYYFLRKAGADVRLVFGVSPADGTGHCWIVRDGQIYKETTDPDAQFVDVVALPLR